MTEVNVELLGELDALLDVVLGTPAYRRAFSLFLSTGGPQENLDFLQAVRDYERRPDKKKAIEIIDRYVRGTRDMGVFQVKGFDTEARTAWADVRQDYHGQRVQAQRMGFFKRHWTAGDRKAASGLFADAVAVAREQLMAWLPRFFQDNEGKAIRTAVERRFARNNNGARLQYVDAPGM